MQLAAARRAVAVQRLKKLHGGGHNDRGVPVFGGKRLAVGGFIAVFGCRILRPSVMLQHIFAPQNAGKNLGVLVDDGGVGDDVNHALQPLRGSLCQCKRQRGHGLAAAGGYGQRVQPARLALPGGKAGTQNVAAPCI